MKLQLTRPIVFFDLETTGTDTRNDRIIHIAMIKMHTNLGWEASDWMVNPGMPIPPESTKVHGITDQMVDGLLDFQSIAEGVMSYIEDCDLCGYNLLAFDIPMLYQEFCRAGIDWDHLRHHVIDAGNIFKIRETRTLEAAVEFYTGERHTNAHNACGDAMATMRVLAGQLDRYNDLPVNVESLATLSNYGKKRADVTGKFTVDESGQYVLNFGPNKGRLAAEHPDYLQWMMSRDFPADAISICEEILYPPRIGYTSTSLPVDDSDDLPF